MPRSQFQHPALAQQSLQRDLAVKDEEDLDTIPGWERFSPLKKQLLTVMPWFANAIAAYRYIKDDTNATDKGLYQLRSNDPEFAAALDYRRGSAVRMVRNLGADMLGKAMLRLNYYIDADGVPARDQLKAIEMIMNMNHIDSTNATDKSGIINYGEVNMFNIPASQTAEPSTQPVDNVVVEVQSIDVT